MHNLPTLTKSEIADRIDRLAISADAKVLLSQIAESTARVGEQIISVGRQVISFIFDLYKQFPNTTFGAIAGFVVATLIASVPFVGVAIGAILVPLFVALGIAKGANIDMDNAAMALRLAAFEAQLRAVEAGK